MTARDFATLADSRESLAVAGQTISTKMRENAALRREISELRDALTEANQEIDILRGELASAREQLQAGAA